MELTVQDFPTQSTSYKGDIYEKSFTMSFNLHQAQSHEVLRSWQNQRNDINHHKDFVLPLFITNDDNAHEPIEAMPEIYRYGCSRVVSYLEPLVYSYGLRAVLLFPVPAKSDQEKLRVKYKYEAPNEDEDTILSISSSTSHSTTNSSRSSSDDEGETRPVLPERLIPDDSISSSISQNPFLNRNEEEDHLLGEQTHQESENTSAPNTLIVIKGGLGDQVTRSLDIKLIKNLALEDEYNPVLRLIPMLRAKFPDLLIMCDVCLCAFTSTGHCCLFDNHERSGSNFHQGRMGSRIPHLSKDTVNVFPMSNNISCKYLAKLSVEYALRGCHVVAPSDMMDGRIQVIRKRLDESKLNHVSIMSYSAKFASAFYGPFRNATGNAPDFGDRRGYQLPPGSRTLAIRAVERDLDQGADFVMVKPAGPYLDIVRDIKEMHPEVPIAVYQVSGEYSMLRMAGKANLVDLKLAVNEMLTSFRRAGATIIISYFTPELLKGEL